MAEKETIPKDLATIWANPDIEIAGAIQSQGAKGAAVRYGKACCPSVVDADESVARR